MRISCIFAITIVWSLSTLSSLAQSTFVSGYNDGWRTYAVISRNGVEYRTDQTGTAVNRHLWNGLSIEDRTKLVRTYSWHTNRRRADFGVECSNDMATHYNDISGWSNLVNALKDKQMANEYTYLRQLFGPDATLDLPNVYTEYPSIRDSAEFRDAVALKAEIMQDFANGRALYQTLTKVKWDQVSVAVKAISKDLLQIIVDNFMAPVITSGSKPLSNEVAKMFELLHELKNFIQGRQSPNSTPPTPAEIIARIEVILAQIERSAHEVAGEIHTKKPLLQSYVNKINTANRQMRDDRQQRGTAKVSALQAEAAQQPPSATLVINGSGSTAKEIWQSKNTQCMNTYNQLCAEWVQLQKTLADEKEVFIAPYINAAAVTPELPKPTQDYFAEMQSMFGSPYATLSHPLGMVNPWSKEAFYEPHRRLYQESAADLRDAGGRAQQFLPSALERINGLHARAKALDAYQESMGSWSDAQNAAIPATWKTTDNFPESQLRDLNAVIAVIATPEHETTDLVTDFETTTKIFADTAPAINKGMADRVQDLSDAYPHYESLRFNVENSFSFKRAAHVQSDRLHQRPEFRLEQGFGKYLVDGVEYQRGRYSVNVPYLRALIAAKPSEPERQRERLRIVALLEDLCAQEFDLERRLQIAQASFEEDCQELDAWQQSVESRLRMSHSGMEYLAAEFQRGIGKNVLSVRDLVLNSGNQAADLQTFFPHDEGYCCSINTKQAIQQISGMTDAYYEMLDIYTDMEFNKAAKLAMTDSEFSAYYNTVWRKCVAESAYEPGTLLQDLRSDGVDGIEYPGSSLGYKINDRLIKLNALRRAAQANASWNRQQHPTAAIAAAQTLGPGIRGRVLTRLGTPVAGVIISCAWNKLVWTTTDSAGQYEFDFSVIGPPSDETLLVKPESEWVFQPQAQSINFNNDAHTVNFILTDDAANGGTLAGKISSVNGKGVGGVQIQITTSDGEFLADLFTSPDGKFSLTGLAAGDYIVRPVSETQVFLPAERSIALPPATAQVDFQLQEASVSRQLRLSGNLAFGDVGVAQSSVRTLRLHNNGNVALQIEGVYCPPGFSGNWQGTLAAGAVRDVAITFTPDRPSFYNADIAVFSAAMTNIATLACSGTGVAMPPTLTAEPLNFGPVTTNAIAVRMLRLRNNGDRYAQVTALSLPADFSTDWLDGVPVGAVREVPVSYKPTMLKTYGGTVTIHLADAAPITTSCSGAGVAQRIPVDWLRAHGLPEDGSLDFADPDGDGTSVFQAWQAGADPTPTNLKPSDIAENQPIGTLVGYLSKPFADSSATYTYTLVTGVGSTDNAAFTISGNALKTAAVFNYETKSNYTIRVRRMDHNSLAYEIPLRVTVSDVNEAPTGIMLSNTTIADQTTSGALVGEFAATDPDDGDSFNYTLVAGSGSGDNAAFTITACYLRTATNFVYAIKSSYNIRVRVSDRGGLTYEKPFVITVAPPGTFYNLVVRSEHGNDLPVITKRCPAGAPVRIAMTNAAVNADGYQFVCSGWTGTGSAPASGTAADTGSFTLNSDTTVTWHWQTNVLLTAMAGAGGTITGRAGWFAFGTTASLSATAQGSATFNGWLGDTAGCTVNGNTISAPMDRPRTLVAHFQGGAINPIPGDQIPGDLIPDAVIPLRASANYDGFVYGADGTVHGTLTLSAKMALKKATDRATKVTTVNTNWTLSAKAILQGGSINFKAKQTGTLDEASFTARTGEVMTLAFGNNTLGGTLVGGRVSEAINVVGARNAFADRKDTEAQGRLALVKGLYNVALMDDDAALAHGYISLTVGNAGAVKLAGKLSDGTALSGSAKLLEQLSVDGWQAVALYKPLYSKKGFIGGVLWLNPADKIIRNDSANDWFVDWVSTDIRKGAFVRELSVVGGAFGGLGDVAELTFVARLPDDLPPPVAGLEGGAWMDEAFPGELPITINGARLTLPKGVAPKKVTLDGLSFYDYSGINPATAALTYTARSGLFKGTFKLYYDGANPSGTLQHKVLKTAYQGIVVPLRDAASDDAPLGFGFGITTINRQKHVIPVFLLK